MTLSTPRNPSTNSILAGLTATLATAIDGWDLPRMAEASATLATPPTLDQRGRAPDSDGVLLFLVEVRFVNTNVPPIRMHLPLPQALDTAGVHDRLVGMLADRRSAVTP